MSDWLDGLADALGLARLSEQETKTLLGAAREVAHRVERKETPLAAFLVGMAAGERAAGGTPRSQAFDSAVASLIGRLPPSEPEA